MISQQKRNWAVCSRWNADMSPREGARCIWLQLIGKQRRFFAIDGAEAKLTLH